MHDRYFYKQTNNQYNMRANKTNLDKLFNCDLISIHSMEYLKKKNLLKEIKPETGIYFDVESNQNCLIPHHEIKSWKEKKILHMIFQDTKRVTVTAGEYYPISWIRCTHKK